MMNKKQSKKDVSPKIQRILSGVHLAFMQPKTTQNGKSLRKEYWQEIWTEVKRLSPTELEEVAHGVETVRHTLGKLHGKLESVRTKKLKALAEKISLEDHNLWEEDEFLDSSASLPVFNVKEKRNKGRRWVITTPIEKPKNATEICQAVWTIITNRAIGIVDSGRKDVKPNKARDLMIERHRLAVLPNFLDDKTITDPLTGKPVMNLYMINGEVKETMLWLLAERAKREQDFRKLFARFLQKEIVKKEKLFEWAKKFTPQVQQILKDIDF